MALKLKLSEMNEGQKFLDDMQGSRKTVYTFLGTNKYEDRAYPLFENLRTQRKLLSDLKVEDKFKFAETQENLDDLREKDFGIEFTIKEIDSDGRYVFNDDENITEPNNMNTLSKENKPMSKLEQAKKEVTEAQEMFNDFKEVVQQFGTGKTEDCFCVGFDRRLTNKNSIDGEITSELIEFNQNESAKDREVRIDFGEMPIDTEFLGNIKAWIVRCAVIKKKALKELEEMDDFEIESEALFNPKK